MGISAKGIFRKSPNSCSSYCRWEEIIFPWWKKILIKLHLTKPSVIHDFVLAGNEPKLSSIIHEINECETSNILSSLGYNNASITLASKMILRNRWIFTLRHYGVNEKVWITHIISPYGVYGCVMPRAKYRTRWA